MRLPQAIEGLSAAELRSSEVYLRAALASGELEERQFFIDMAQEELKHARTLLEMSPQAKVGSSDLALSSGDLEAVNRTIDEAMRSVQKAKGLDHLFSALARMEKGELNSIYEGILHLYTNHLVPWAKVETFRHSTERHLDMLRRAGEKFALGAEARKEIAGLSVKPVDYYKNIT
jgi:hypothetical protein